MRGDTARAHALTAVSTPASKGSSPMSDSRNSTRKKVATAVGGAAVVGAAIALTAGTFSYFSDQQGVDGGEIGTGSLTLSASVRHDGQWGAIHANRIVPGWERAETITFRNTGNVPGTVRAVFQVGGSTVLGDEMLVCNGGPGSQSCTSLTNAESITKGGLPLGRVGPHDSVSKTITFRLPTSTGNEAQDKNVTIHVKGVITQIT